MNAFAKLCSVCLNRRGLT